MKRGGKISGPILLCVVALVSTTWCAEGKYSLILAEYGKDSDGDQTQSLVRYRFKGGSVVAKENILTRKTSDLRLDLGRNQIYQNRYVITDWGDVVDLATGQMLFKSDGELVAVDRNSDSVIVRVERDDRKGIYAFGLTSHLYRRVKRPGHWSTRGAASPNGQLLASGNGAEIWLRRPSGEMISLGKNFSRGGTFECSAFATPTFIWLDDEHLLTQRGNGHLVVVDVKGNVEPLVTIPAVEAPACGPQFRRDEDEHIYYEAKQKAWRIDVATRTFEPYLWEAKGNGFDIEYQHNATYGHRILYQGVEIGRWWCGSARTAPQHIAVPFGPVGSNLAYPEGVKVWSAESGVWTTITPDWLTAIIGWTEE